SMHVVGYPVDVPSAPIGAADGRRDVLYVGRIDPRKGLHHLVNAFARVHPGYPGARLLVAGGPEPQRVLSLAKRASVGGAVEVLGWLDEAGLRAAYARAR